jgi:hypothetical protein
VIGTCPAPAQGAADNTTGLYTGRFGVPPVGAKLFVAVNLFLDGHQSIPVAFWAVVPMR